jgi:Trk K+ transport system NAD-binding subunit
MPGTTEVIDLFDEELKIIRVRAPSVTPLYRQPISELSESRNLKTLRFIAVRRGDKIIVPRDDTHFLMGTKFTYQFALRISPIFWHGRFQNAHRAVNL